MMHYKSKRMQGTRVLMFRTASQNKVLLEQIEEHGGVSLAIPLLSIKAPAPALREAALQLLAGVQSYDWLIFTSQNGVDFTLQLLASLGVQKAQLPKIAVIGNKTLAQLEKHQLAAAFVPSKFVAETFAEEFLPMLSNTDRVLVCKGNLARDVIATLLNANGFEANEAIVYENVVPVEADRQLSELLDSEQVDYIIFTSPSTVNRFMQIITKNGLNKHLQKSMMIAIGPVTKLALSDHGYTDALCPEQYTSQGILSLLLNEIQKEREHMEFTRHRRLRTSANMRALVRETTLSVDDLIYPIFIIAGENIQNEISSMPGVYQLSMDHVHAEMEEVVALGIKSVILFGVPDDQEKDAIGSGAFHDHGIVQEGTRYVKEHFPDILVIADTCLCEYTEHGHCGIVEDGKILNDPTLRLLADTAVSQARAGADIIAPSNMMDGFVTAIRAGLDEAGFQDIPIMSYAVKYSSAFYGPFRDAANSAPKFGDRKAYQMDPANRLEAMREAESDVLEGADFLMVKPALSYLDIVRDVKNNFNVPVVCYNVSGEYAMVKAAAQNGWINEKVIVLEMLTSMKRAGADLIITYFAKDVARYLAE